MEKLVPSPKTTIGNCAFCNNKIPIEIGLSKYPKTIIKDYEQIIDNSGRWDGINKITTSNHEYALFKNSFLESRFSLS